MFNTCVGEAARSELLTPAELATSLPVGRFCRPGSKPFDTYEGIALPNSEKTELTYESRSDVISLRISRLTPAYEPYTASVRVGAGVINASS
jgi:hypothetical protein